MPSFLTLFRRDEIVQWANTEAVFGPGRQGTGYELAPVPDGLFKLVKLASYRALGIDKSVGHDCYVMRYKTGSCIPKHKDTAFFGSRHLRVNAIVQDAGRGGQLLIEDTPYEIRERDAYVFRPDLLDHEVTTITEGERLVWTMGTMLPV